MEQNQRSVDKTAETQGEKMLTEAGKYGKLYLAQSEKQSRVSTLTIAQVSDYWSDIVTCRKFPV